MKQAAETAARRHIRRSMTRLDDVIMGAAMQQGCTSGNVARQSALRAGLPVTVVGMSIDRQCASGLMAVATGAKQIVADGMSVVAGGGLESISLVKNEDANSWRSQDPSLVEKVPAIAAHNPQPLVQCMLGRSRPDLESAPGSIPVGRLWRPERHGPCLLPRSRPFYFCCAASAPCKGEGR
jgi:acetyl-CoA acetyltransferase